MREHPILFSGEMVRAILDGRKTQTRRIMKPQPEIVAGMYTIPVRLTRSEVIRASLQSEGLPSCCPIGMLGDRLWVRETFVYRHKHDRFYYKADSEFDPYAHNGWSPSIHMPRKASRITLEIKNVRVERLQNISDEDARAEGALPFFEKYASVGRDQIIAGQRAVDAEHRASFVILWDDIYYERVPWSSNPWVWVVEFKRVSA